MCNTDISDAECVVYRNSCMSNGECITAKLHSALEKHSASVKGSCSSCKQLSVLLFLLSQIYRIINGNNNWKGAGNHCVPFGL